MRENRTSRTSEALTFKSLVGFAAAFLLLLSIGRAEPLNVIVGDLTFKRPPGWVFEPPKDKSRAVSRFVIPLENEKPGADVRFYLSGKTPAQARKLWKTFAQQGATFRVEEKYIGKLTITYITLRGKLSVPGEKQEENVGFVGAVIPTGETYMHVRMTGPAELVEKSTPLFRRMIEDAVRERDAETTGN